MRYLLDTCVLSEINHPKGNPEVKQRIAEIAESDAFISVISIGEMLNGITRLDDGARKQSLTNMIESMRRENWEQLLPVSIDAASLWGIMSGTARRKGVQIHPADGLIAATALEHGLHIVTRNVKDFEPTGAMLINPWDHTDDKQP